MSEREMRMGQAPYERGCERRDAFMALVCEWHRLRAVEADPDRPGDDAVDVPRGERIDELARRICATPAVLPWMIVIKLEVLEYEFQRFGTNSTDYREVAMIGGIKADLVSRIV